MDSSNQTNIIHPPTAGVIPTTISQRIAPLADWAADLLPEELPAISRAAPSRAWAFSTSRHLAHTIQRDCGEHPQPVRQHQDGQPLWPQGIRGSVSHSRTHAWVAMSRAPEIASIGIDLETIGRAKPAMASRIAFPDELESACRLLESLDISPDLAITLLFSAKEAVYKCQYPLTASWLGFRDVRIDLCPDHTFSASLSNYDPVLPPPLAFRGYFTRGGTHILTLCWATRPPPLE